MLPSINGKWKLYMKINDWDKLEGQFENGSLSEIQGLCCPDCGGEIRYEYTFEARGALSIRCLSCGKETIECGLVPPPWVIEKSEKWQD